MGYDWCMSFHLECDGVLDVFRKVVALYFSCQMVESLCRMHLSSSA